LSVYETEGSPVVVFSWVAPIIVLIGYIVYVFKLKGKMSDYIIQNPAEDITLYPGDVTVENYDSY
jgi:hypothetical protein